MGSQVLVPFRGSEDSNRHLKWMGELGQIAEENGGIMRFIHVSGLGSSPSRILRAKAAAEEAIMRELPEVSRERLFCCDKGGKNKYMEGHSSKTIV
ncbi:NADH dehydrogenase [ubiquinone] 1 alpha subcomplex subunit 9, mitochondrial-like isoform X1 [Actinidia eriantha]|uniref:NADH dehydrogenase [ubiquinone] 1 alpha subcomplex subunit 9, mitochondrial-like isoform X1 n=1 Tax=Actinidia eriantha TaxID=165200 RepID=UPI00258B24CB|nr:NADH dehydrogenase [ubiquinone] 1 alpha subcomplex subunit 9, mitochondrial-like isoform X1 [Actinidia eriantha]XP_057479775.1 NADH dehydrogenase [ubiquinone] 1 alpha subcomplex subunit 9, mitochondrial-like isoform X1 [Actinidia eriantha]XP_057479776.1 NADH dehydrogenase [ubiquinone] 1 alpha subcomplex subunit 9, mitochondrial-like isoform X1 [Actinidia eriantha]